MNIYKEFPKICGLIWAMLKYFKTNVLYNDNRPRYPVDLLAIVFVATIAFYLISSYTTIFGRLFFLKYIW